MTVKNVHSASQMPSPPQSNNLKQIRTIVSIIIQPINYILDPVKTYQAGNGSGTFGSLDAEQRIR